MAQLFLNVTIFASYICVNYVLILLMSFSFGHFPPSFRTTPWSEILFYYLR